MATERKIHQSLGRKSLTLYIDRGHMPNCHLCNFLGDFNSSIEILPNFMWANFLFSIIINLQNKCDF